MSKKSITDFFKPFAFPRQNKRPLSTDQSEETRPSQISRSTTPKNSKNTTPEPAKASVEQHDALLTSSQSSLLSSLRNSTPRGLDDPPSQDHTLPLRDFGDENPVQSNASNRLDHQAPIFNSSQRIVRNGEVIIKDSDDERSDSDISLEDLEDLIAPRKRPLASSHPSDSEIRTPLSPAKTRSKTGRSTRKGHRDPVPTAADSTPSTSTALPRYKFSLGALIKQSKNDADSRKKIDDAKHLLEDFEEQKPIPQGIDDLLAALVGGQDEDNGTGKQDLKGAMERTEALYQDRIWSFFDPEQEYEDIEPVVCPPTADSYWRDLLEAFLSGYVGECASLRKLPHELLVWLLDSACYERRDDLQNSYCQTLRHLPSNSLTQSLVRRRLALSFLFHDQTFLTKDSQSLIDLKTITRHLHKPQFAVNPATDYASLAALIGILVIGLDKADPPPNDAARNATIAFNADIDILAKVVHKLYTLVIDTKAAHRKRTEAKEALESFETSLKAGIRTEPKPRGTIVDDDAGFEKQRSIMKGFIRREMPVGNVDGVV
ncbi:MAG: hypothetical protein Q9194_005424 [Teloschistes cf. exilis]